MTWTKLGDEWPEEARDLSDAAYRTHVDALCWSNRRRLDFVIPKRDLKRFAETHEPDQAAKECVHTGWWEDRGDTWFIGVRFPQWQPASDEVDKRRDETAERVRKHRQRKRQHDAGDHSECRPESCDTVRNAVTGAVTSPVTPGRDGTGRELRSLPVPDSSRGGGVTEVDAREREPTPAPLSDEPPPCRKHRGLPRHEIDDCGGCGRLRREWEVARARAVERPSKPQPVPVPWCGDCESPDHRWVKDAEPAAPCPYCSPQAQAQRAAQPVPDWERYA